MRFVLVCLSLMLAGLDAAAAEVVKVSDVAIKGYGIYSAKQIDARPATETATGHVTILENFKLEKQTEIVPGKKGLRFGVNFVINGSPRGQTVTLTMKTIFPAPAGITRPTGEHFNNSKFEEMRKIGEPTFRTYSFDNDWEIVPGDWIFEFYYQDRKIAEKRFTVVAQ